MLALLPFKALKGESYERFICGGIGKKTGECHGQAQENGIDCAACAGRIDQPVFRFPISSGGGDPGFDLEYEYLLVNRELDIDKIYSRKKRKQEAQFQLEEMELFAPLNSRRMEHYNSNTHLKIRDYSSGADGAGVYAMIIRDGQEACKVLLEPDEQMLDALSRIFPNKVFMD